jgi:hydrogenase expression/formation protein HypE
MNSTLSSGKLDFPILDKLLKKYGSNKDPRVVVGPKLGEDAAVIEFPDRYLVTKTDPITFASNDIGWYAVQINANDIATTGAVPKWFMATILLPDGKTTEKDAEIIFSQISSACKLLNISLIGGHTEITHNLDRPIVVGSMLGEVAKNKLVRTSGAKAGDVIILTKGIVIEGTSIIAREKEHELRERGYSDEFIKTCQSFLHNPGLSVVKDALLANKFNIHAMHDPTEGGLATGLFEIAHASNVGIRIDKEKIPIFSESIKLCEEYNLDPLRTITSGALLIAAQPNESEQIISELRKNNIHAVVIGDVKKKEFGLKLVNNKRTIDLKYSAKDEITKIFEKLTYVLISNLFI